MKTLTRTEKIVLAVLSHLTADALGVPYEFHRAAEIPPESEIEMTPPHGFRRSHGSAPSGAYSDDGATMLCLLASLLACPGLDLEDFGRRLVGWYKTGYLAHEGIVFDIGNQTSASIRSIINGVPADRAGGKDENANGNGSLMRVLAVALWHTGTDADLVKLAMRSSLPTHAHPRSLVCCAAYALWVRLTLNGYIPDARPTSARIPGVIEEDRRPVAPGPDPSDACFEEALRLLHAPGMLEEQEQYDELRALWKLMLEERSARSTGAGRAVKYLPNGSGYVVDCLLSAVRANRGAKSYEQVVRRAIAFGNDTDTTACVAGPIAALRFGEIPDRWFAAAAASHLNADANDVLEALRSHLKAAEATS